MFFFRRRKRTKKSLGHLRLCPRPRNALKVEKEREVGLSGDNRGGFLRYAYGCAVRFGRNDVYTKAGGRGAPLQIGRNDNISQTYTMSFRALVEKSPASETKPNVHD